MQYKNSRLIQKWSVSTATALCLLLLLTALDLEAGAVSVTTFTNFSLSETLGTVCPGSADCHNLAGEPQIRADAAGNFYASSERGLGGGTLAWKSTDGGLHYRTLQSPNQTSNAAGGFGPGGGDTDLATAPARNAAGFYNVYVASLSLANVDVSTSKDGGATWTLNPTAATIPGDDREWIAADGASKVCISYHDAATSNLDVNCSYNAGATFTQLASALDSAHLFLLNNNMIGNLVIDPRSHNVYQIFSGIASASEAACGTAGTCGYHAVWLGVSTNGGRTFTDYPVYLNPDPTASYGHQFVNLSVDRAGNLYAVYSDNHNLYYSYSTSQGQTWSKPVQVNQAPSFTAIMPWSVAGSAGHLDIVWYGSPYYDGTTPPDNYPASAAWNVYFAQSLNALKPTATFTQTAASPVIHYGGVCEGGIGCTTGNRDLYDDFGIAVNPRTGLASIIYTTDQYTNDANNPPGYGCDPSTNNSIYCDHTSIATQTGGPGL